jgi:hypothetical protein
MKQLFKSLAALLLVCLFATAVATSCSQKAKEADHPTEEADKDSTAHDHPAGEHPTDSTAQDSTRSK